MPYKIVKIILLFFFIGSEAFALTKRTPILGVENIDSIVNMLKDKKVAVVVNQSSILIHNQKTIHLIDTLLNRGINVVKIFTPEHGFLGLADAGAFVGNENEMKTNLPIISLFGAQLEPTEDQLKNVDILIYDIQDVGVRFYTYISTLHYVVKACADYGKPLIVLDRPNPNDYVDGPVMEDNFKSFIGVDNLPILYGMTVGELAIMINKEGWLKSKADSCKLTVIPLKKWRHGDFYSLPIKASPNLPNDQSIRLYASICILGPTGCSVGRGTKYPFQVIGFPSEQYGKFNFTPASMPGSALHPIHEGKKCYGIDLRNYSYKGGLNLQFLLSFYKKSGKTSDFIKDKTWFDRLIGNDKLRNQLQVGLSEKEIRDSWKQSLENFRRKRRKYLLYPDYK